MQLIQIKPPVEEPITTDEARRQINIDWTDQDDTINELIAEARAHVEDYCHLAIMQQDWRLIRDSFIDDRAFSIGVIGSIIELPRPPLVRVNLVRYIDEGGALNEIPIVDQSFVRTADSGQLSCIGRPWNMPWPVTRPMPGSVQIEYTAGYTNRDCVPGAIKRAIKLLVAHWFKQREAVSVGSIVNEMPFGVKNLLAPYRVAVM